MDAKNFPETPANFNAFAIPGGTRMRVGEPRGTTLRVEQGALWITETGRTEDVIVSRGESFRFGRDGAAVVSALRKHPLTIVAVERFEAPENVQIESYRRNPLAFRIAVEAEARRQRAEAIRAALRRIVGFIAERFARLRALRAA